MLGELLPIIKGPVPASPPRRPFSIRRTSTIDTHWPDGMGGNMLQIGAARDLLTRDEIDDPRIVVLDRFEIKLSQAREILQISATPDRPDLPALMGARAGGHLRSAIINALPAEVAAGTPLYLLLDDVGGASLVAPFAWAQWNEETKQQITASLDLGGLRHKMAGVCIGFAPGSPALDSSRETLKQNDEVPPLGRDGDPHAWHELVDWHEVSARRARCIDVWFEDEDVVIQAFFQDSAATQSGERRAVHEYLLYARADRRSGTLQALSAEPRILPFDVCPAAIFNIGRMVGTPLGDLRQAVVAKLPRTDGCTHLNDTIRSLAEVPQLSVVLAEAVSSSAS